MITTCRYCFVEMRATGHSQLECNAWSCPDCGHEEVESGSWSLAGRPAIPECFCDNCFDERMIKKQLQELKKKHMPPCGNIECGCSTGICESMTFGSGELDEWGYWEIPCPVCARAWEIIYPEYGKCWPFKKEA